MRYSDTMKAKCGKKLKLWLMLITGLDKGVNKPVHTALNPIIPVKDYQIHGSRMINSCSNCLWLTWKPVNLMVFQFEAIKLCKQLPGTSPNKKV